VFSYDCKHVQREQILNTTDTDPNEITLDTIIVETVAKIRLTFLVKAPEGTQINKLKIIGDLPLLGYVYPSNIFPAIYRVSFGAYDGTVKLN